MAKPKLALYWAAACGGCDVAVLDTNEKILDIANLCRYRFLAHRHGFQIPSRQGYGG